MQNNHEQDSISSYFPHLLVSFFKWLVVTGLFVIDVI